MRICHCKDVSDRKIESALGEGARTVSQVCRATGAGKTCGGCVPALREIVETRRDLPMAIARQVPPRNASAESEEAHEQPVAIDQALAAE